MFDDIVSLIAGHVLIGAALAIAMDKCRSLDIGSCAMVVLAWPIILVLVLIGVGEE